MFSSIRISHCSPGTFDIEPRLKYQAVSLYVRQDDGSLYVDLPVEHWGAMAEQLEVVACELRRLAKEWEERRPELETVDEGSPK